MQTRYKKSSAKGVFGDEEELRVEVLRDIPGDMVDSVVKDFESSGAISLTKEKQRDGAWSVIAKFDK